MFLCIGSLLNRKVIALLISIWHNNSNEAVGIPKTNSLHRVDWCKGGNMSVLFFWRGDNYRRDTRLFGKSYVLNQNSKHILGIVRGQHVWAFTRREDKTYVLAVDLVVTGTNVNQPSTPDYKYGKYQVIGSRQNSRYFDISQGDDAEPLIRSLSYRPQAAILGHSFQGLNGVRQLSFADEQKLTSFASALPTI